MTLEPRPLFVLPQVWSPGQGDTKGAFDMLSSATHDYRNRYLNATPEEAAKAVPVLEMSWKAKKRAQELQTKTRGAEDLIPGTSSETSRAWRGDPRTAPSLRPRAAGIRGFQGRVCTISPGDRQHLPTTGLRQGPGGGEDQPRRVSWGRSPARPGKTPPTFTARTRRGRRNTRPSSTMRWRRIVGRS